MRNLKRMAAFLTALILCLGLSVTVFAAEADKFEEMRER